MKISLLVVMLAMLVGCTALGSQKTIRKLSPEWYNLAEKRLKENPLPKMDVIFIDRARWPTEAGFVAYVEKNVPEGAKVRYVKGKNMLGHEIIRYAVIYYEISKH